MSTGNAEIDRLELAIESSANDALGELDRLSSKLRNVGSLIRNINRNGNFDISFSRSSIQKVGRDMADNLIKGFNLDKAETSVKKQVRSLTKEIAEGFAKNGKSYDWGAPAEKIASILKKNGGVVNDVTEDYQRLYEAIKAINKIKIRSADAKSLGDDYRNRNGLLRQKFSQKEGTPLDTVYGELSGQFKGILPDASDIRTVEDQFQALNDALSYYYKLRDSGLSQPEGFEDDVYASIVNEVKNLTSELERAKKANQEVKSVKVDGNEKSINGIADALGNLSDSMDKMSGSGISPSDIGKIAQNIGKFEDIDSGKILEVANSIKELGSSFSFLEQINGSASELLAAVREVRKLGNSSSLGKKLNDSWKPDDMSNLRIHRGDEYIDDVDFDGPLRNPVELETEASYNAGAMTATFGEAASKIKNYADAVEQFGKQAGNALNELGNTPISLNTKSFEAQIRNIKSQMQELRSEGIGPGDSQYDDASKQLAILKEQKAYYEKYYKELARLSVASEKAIGSEGGAASLTADQMEELAREKAGASLENKKLAKSAQSSSSSLGKETSKTRSAAQSFARFAKSCNGLLSVISKPIINGFKNLTKEIRNSQKQYNTGFSTPRMIGMSVLYSTVFGTISSINQAIADGSNNLVQYSSEYNHSISSIVSALTYLKNAWAAAFAPIVNVVAPYLQSFIEMLASALNSVGSFFAALTGKKLVVQAKKVWQDYGATLGDSGKEAADGLKDAADAAKDLQNYTLGIDELNIIQPQDASSNPGSGSGGQDSGLGNELLPSDMFETVEVEGEVAGFAQRLREAFLAEDWEGIGKILADGINSGLEFLYQAISWENVGPKITYFCNAFTTAFNSLADNINWDLLGSTVGAGINTVVNTLNLLIDGIDWTGLGSHFAVGLMGMVDEVNWFELGRLIGNKFMIAWETLLGFVTSLDYGEIGRSLAEGFNGMISEIDLGDIGTAIGTVVAGIIEMFREFFANANWGEVGNQIKEGISNAISAASDGGKNDGILAAMLGVGTIAGLSQVIGPISKTFSDIAKLVGGSGLVKAFKDASTATGKTGLSGAFDLLKGALKGITGPVGIAVGAVAAIALGIVDLWNTSDSFRQSVSDMWDEISDAFSYAKTAIWDNTLSPLWDNLKDFFGSLYDLYESSGLKGIFEEVVVTVGNLLSDNIAGAIKIVATAFETVGDIAEDTIDVLSGIVEFVTGVFSGDWDRAWSGVEKIVEGFKSGVEDLFEGLWKTIGVIFSPVIDFFNEKFSDAYSAVKKVWQAAPGWFEDRWEDIQKAFSSVVEFFRKTFDNAYKAAQKIWQNVGKWFQDRWKDIQQAFSTVSSFFQKTFDNGYNSVKNAFKNIGSWFGDRWNDIKNVFSPVATFFGDAFNKAASAVKKAFNGIGSTFKSIANQILNPIKNAVNAIIDGVNWIIGKLGVGTKLPHWSFPGFAKGSNGLPQDTIGMVNDQKGATYKELIVPPNGKPFIPEGRNVLLPMKKGTKIMPAKQTKEFIENVPHFKFGIGDFFAGAWDSFRDFTGDIWDYISNPSKIVKMAIDKFTDFSGIVEPWLSIAGGVVNKILDSAVSFVTKLFEKAGGEGVEGAVRWALKIANDDSHGYDQASRWGNPDYDCSSFVISAFEQAGIRLKSAGATYTGNMYGAAKSVGFKDVTGSGGLKRGDILLNRRNHTALYIGNGQIVQASINEHGRTTGGRPGDQTGREIYVRSYYDYPWDNILRFVGYENGIGKIRLSDFLGNIPKLADGGILTPGQLFMANEKGPELLSRAGNRTTVMNNNQIVKSVSDGVESAMTNQVTRLEALMMQMIENQERILQKDLSLNIDGKRTSKQLSKANKNAGYNFSPA